MTAGSTLEARIKEKAQALGFSMAGITPAEPSPRLQAYLDWVKAGMHGTMGYLAREDRLARRRDLSVILPGAQSLIVVGLDYFTFQLPDNIANDPARGRFSNYAWGVDYHDVMLERLEELAAFVEAEVGGKAATRAYVDTGAILERSHAERAGLGFVGKNTVLIHPQRGSFFFLGEVITTAALTPDEPNLDAMPGCGTCTRCLEACPTSAFPRPHVLDARRCISYLTIEYKGFIPRELRPLMGNWVYGCDVCQQVCPWQRFAKPTPFEDAFAPASLDRAAPPLADLLALTDESFAACYKDTPIYRIKRERLVRNACIAAGNRGLPELATSLLPLLDDESALVRGHAAWALGQLGGHRDAITAAHPRETDEHARAEMTAVLITPEANQP